MELLEEVKNKLSGYYPKNISSHFFEEVGEWMYYIINSPKDNIVSINIPRGYFDNVTFTCGTKLSIEEMVQKVKKEDLEFYNELKNKACPVK